MTITLNGTSGITDADGGTVLSTADLASLAQAQAGTDNTTVMTPLRTAQEITALGGGMTLLGTLTTTSGTTQTLSGLNLSSYKAIHAYCVSVDPSNTTTQRAIAVGGLSTIAVSDGPLSHVFVLDFASSLGFSVSGASLNPVSVGSHTLTTASTSISVTTLGVFMAGTVYFYGVK